MILRACSWLLHLDIELLLVKLYILQYRKEYREDFLYYWGQWRHTKRWEGGFRWAQMVFNEYSYPGWGNHPSGQSPSPSHGKRLRWWA